MTNKVESDAGESYALNFQQVSVDKSAVNFNEPVHHESVDSEQQIHQEIADLEAKLYHLKSQIKNSRKDENLEKTFSLNVEKESISSKENLNNHGNFYK